jgi:sporulation protein YlmC with PRC-barrel domain
MKRFITAVTIAALALPVAPALADEGKKPAAATDVRKGVDDRRPAETRNEADARREDARARDDKNAMRPHPGGLIEANWLIGSRLHDTEGRDIGKIQHIWIDPKDGRAKEVVVSVGATLGIGGKDKVVAWKDLNVAWKDQKLYVTVDQKAMRDVAEVYKDRNERGPAASPDTTKRR